MREWWVNLRDKAASDYDLAHVAYIPRPDYVHVIEHSAYLAEKARAALSSLKLWGENL